MQARELPKTESVLTIVGGKIVYDAKVIGSSESPNRWRAYEGNR
jgi:hypothetical protein